MNCCEDVCEDESCCEDVSLPVKHSGRKFNLSVWNYLEVMVNPSGGLEYARKVPLRGNVRFYGEKRWYDGYFGRRSGG
jgi:hypothetical protein